MIKEVEHRQHTDSDEDRLMSFCLKRSNRQVLAKTTACHNLYCGVSAWCSFFGRIDIEKEGQNITAKSNKCNSTSQTTSNC